MNVFQSVVGQESALSELKQALAKKNQQGISHAWLITGPAGAGRSNLAISFAMALECQNGGCGECNDCKTILAGTNPDVCLFNPKTSTITLDQVLPLIDFSYNAPTQENKYKIIIIEDCDRLHDKTGNILLKSIEEPAEHTIWILCSPTAQAVLPTISSRCRILRLVTPSIDAIQDYLVQTLGVNKQTALDSAINSHQHIGIAKQLATNKKFAEWNKKIQEIPLKITSTGAVVNLVENLVLDAKTQAQSVWENELNKKTQDLLGIFGVQSVSDLQGDAKKEFNNELNLFIDGVNNSGGKQSKLPKDTAKKRRLTRVTQDILDLAMLDILFIFNSALQLQFTKNSQNSQDLQSSQSSQNAQSMQSSQSPQNISKASKNIEDLAKKWTKNQIVACINSTIRAREMINASVSPQLAIEQAFMALFLA